MIALFARNGILGLGEVLWRRYRDMLSRRYRAVTRPSTSATERLTDLILITSMKIKVQIEPTTIASIRVKPCGENVAHWSTGQLPTEPRSATQPISFTSYFSLPPVRSSPFSKGSFL